MINRQNIEDVFDDCLNRLQNGQNIDSILRLYPEHSERLRALLELSQATVKLMAVPPQEVSLARDRARFRLLQEMEAPAPPIKQSRGVIRLMSRVAVVLLFGFIVTLIMGQNSLPGDALYGMKQFTQNVREAFGTDSVTLEQERLLDIQQVIDERRITQVNFTGTISAIDENMLIVEGFKVIPPVNTIEGLFVGAMIEINGITTVDGLIAAGDITIIIPAEATPTSTPTMTSTVTATLTMTATATTTPQPSPSNTPTVTSTDTESPTATATATQVTPSATSTPTRLIPTDTSVPPTASHTPTTQAQTSGECVPQRPEGWITYTVRAGDTLSGLAAASDTSIDDLREVNCISITGFIIIGQQLFLEDMPQFNANNDNDGDDSSNSGSGSDDSDDDDDDSSNSGSGSDDSDDDDDDSSNNGSGSDDSDDDEIDD